MAWSPYQKLARRGVPLLALDIFMLQVIFRHAASRRRDWDQLKIIKPHTLKRLPKRIRRLADQIELLNSDPKLDPIGLLIPEQKRVRRNIVQKIREGVIGEVVGLSATYLSGPVLHVDHRDPTWGDMEWQHRNWYSFVWICGDQMVEQHIHTIDFCNWVIGDHPVSVVASGGVAWRPREELYGNIYDHVTADFVYPSGVHLYSACRQYPKGCYRKVWNTVVGSKGRTDGLDTGSKGLDPYVQEHVRLVSSIRGDIPYVNDGMTVAESTLTCIMGREAAYSGMEITWDMIMASKQDLQPKALDYKLAMAVTPVAVPAHYEFV